MSEPATRPAAHRRSVSRRRRKRRRQRLLRLLLLAAVAAVIGGLVVNLAGGSQLDKLSRDKTPSWVDKQIIAVNGGGRRGEKLSGVNDIAIHYVGNPGTTAQQNRDFYDQPDTSVSSHFVIGLEGEVIQCLPLDEKSSATNERNGDTLSIEVCHPEADGKFTQESYDALVKLTAWLCDYCGIGRDRVIRHYDVTGKLCPLYFVEHEDAWQQFLQDVKAY